MLKRVVHSLGLVEQNRERSGSRRKNHPKRTPPPSPPPPPPESYSPSKDDFAVRIIHAGGHQEVYRHAVPAARLMTKYPGMCVARPEVFRVPHESVLWGEDVLMPGHKYILISLRDVEKLKRKLFEEEKSKEEQEQQRQHCQKENNGKLLETTQTRISVSMSVCMSPKDKVDTKNMGGVEDSFFSAKDFYVPKEEKTSTTITRPSRRKGIKGKKPFVAPLPKQRPYRTWGWQPSLPSVKELSP